MRICYVCADHGIPVLGRKGCSTHVRETCRALQEAGHEIFVVSANRGTDESEHHDLDIIEVPPYRSKLIGADLRQFLYNRRLGKVLRSLYLERKPEVVYERYSLYSTAGTKLARAFSLPRILEVNTLLVEEQSHRLHFPGVASKFEDFIVQSAPSIIVVSEPLRDAFVQRGIDENRITIMPMAVDVKRFHPDVPPVDLNSKYNINGKTIAGYVGTLTAWHGIDLLFDVAERFKSEGEDVCIVVIGGDRKKAEENAAMVRSRRLGEHLIFTGSVPYTDVPAYISAMDVAVIPGSVEWASPTKLFEYQASGKPAVAPRLVPVMKVLTDGREGYLFPPNDAEALADRILRLHRDPEERRIMGMRARQKVVDRYAWENNTRGIIDIFNQLLANRTNG